MNKPRLVYLYCSNGSADPDKIPKWSETITSHDPFAAHFLDEGFCYLFRQFIAKQLFDEILVVIESSRSPGSFHIGKGITGLVVPHIAKLNNFLRPDDIIWARGGWRSWFEPLKKWHDARHWLLFYRAASNRGAWPFWDIVLDDLIVECNQDATGRFYYPINKPINPELFFPYQVPKSHNIYDLMIGASHIHDKKGQYKIIPILMEYRKKFDKDLKCVMPGSMKNGLGTSTIRDLACRFDLKIDFPGMVSRHDLNELYNCSRLFVHLGGAGQNDRGPLEAMACGTPVALFMEQYHAPDIRWNHCTRSFHIDADYPERAAQQIHYALSLIDDNWHRGVLQYFHNTHDINTVICPQFSALFNRIFQTPHMDKQTWFDTLLGKEKTCH